MLWMQVDARPTITPSYRVHVSNQFRATTASAGEEVTHSNAGARRELHHVGRGSGVRGAVGGCYRQRRGMLLYNKCMGDLGVQQVQMVVRRAGGRDRRCDDGPSASQMVGTGHETEGWPGGAAEASSRDPQRDDVVWRRGVLVVSSLLF
jgi:hypothetical protein